MDQYEDVDGDGARESAAIDAHERDERMRDQIKALRFDGNIAGFERMLKNPNGTVEAISELIQVMCAAGWSITDPKTIAEETNFLGDDPDGPNDPFSDNYVGAPMGLHYRPVAGVGGNR